MPLSEGDRPMSPPRPTNPPDGPPRRIYPDLSADQQFRVVEILRPGWNKALAKRAERMHAEHARAA